MILSLLNRNIICYVASFATWHHAEDFRVNSVKYVNHSKSKVPMIASVLVSEEHIVNPWDALSIGYLMNHHDSTEYSSRQMLRGYPVDPGSHDPGPGVSPAKPTPRKILPKELSDQMTQQELENYHSMNYSKQEGLVADFLVRQSGFVIEKSQVWIEITRLNGGKSPTHVQVRRFLQFLERGGMKISRQEKRYRANAIMFIDRNWGSIKNYIGVLLQMPREPHC